MVSVNPPRNPPNIGSGGKPPPRPEGAGRTYSDFRLQHMSVRDWFAGQALAGLTVFLDTHRHARGPSSSRVNAVASVASLAYEYADAMLAERIKKRAGPT